MLFRKYYFISALLFIIGGSVYGQVRKDLTIGDIVPTEILNQSFPAIEINGKDTEIRLKDFNGKVVVIDFWMKWCTACINAMPKAAALEQEFGDQLAIVAHNQESSGKIKEFLATHPTVRNSGLKCTIVGDTVLKGLFPHHLLPHYAWISPSGKVVGFTGAEGLTAQNVSLALAGKQLEGKTKTDLPKGPLFLADKDLLPIHYSILTKGQYLGLGSGNQYRREGKLLYGHAITNTSLGFIYHTIAFHLFRQKGLKIGKEDYMLHEVQDTLALSEIYNYELTLPVSEAQNLYPMMLEGLNRALPYEGKIEQRSGNWVFVIRDKEKIF